MIPRKFLNNFYKMFGLQNIKYMCKNITKEKLIYNPNLLKECYYFRLLFINFKTILFLLFLVTA